MSIHKSVLLKEAIESLSLKNDSVVVDVTFGGGGHSQEILKKISEGRLIGIDADEKAINESELQNDPRVNLVINNFSDLENILENLKIKKVDAILADLGWSSDQLIGKGMSFQENEELDMRLSQEQELTAKKVVNEYEPKDLEKIIQKFGEERFFKSIVKKIVEYRAKRKIETTQELAEIIKEAIPEKFHFGRNPATRTFQAIRIEVNQELENLKKFIGQAVKVLNPGGRLAIISFHSLEDRIVKDMFRENARGCICPPDFPQCVCGNKSKVAVITKKPITPEAEEIKKNLRSRSAKLRVCEKVQSSQN